MPATSRAGRLPADDDLMAQHWRIRRGQGVRAFESKTGGWTLVSPAGRSYRMRGAVAEAIWAAAAGEGIRLDALVAALAAHYPQIDRRRIQADLLRFARSLAAAEFVRLAPGR